MEFERSTAEVKRSRADRERGRQWVRAMGREECGRLGDDLVLGTFSWFEWGLSAKPSAAFLNGADDERISREIMED